MNSNVLEALMGDPIELHLKFVGLGIGITGALFLSQAVRHSANSFYGTGWFEMTGAQCKEMTGLTRHGQEKARRALSAFGLLHESKRGSPARLHYRVDFERLRALLDARQAGGDASKQGGEQ